MNVTAPMMVAPTQAPIASARQMAPWRSSLTGISGEGVLTSCRSSSHRHAAASAVQPAMGSAADQVIRCACSSASSSGTMNPVNSHRPGQSNRTRPLPMTFVFSRAAMYSATSPTGRLTRNTDRQPNPCVSHPPATGPKVDAIMKVPAM